MTATPVTERRIGGHVVVETLAALGARVAFGVPGVHALEASGIATAPPSGPAYLEIPVDVLPAEADPAPVPNPGAPEPRAASPGAVPAVVVVKARLASALPTP